MKISTCDGLPSLIDELNESESGVLLNGVLPLLKHTEIVWIINTGNFLKMEPPVEKLSYQKAGREMSCF